VLRSCGRLASAAARRGDAGACRLVVRRNAGSVPAPLLDQLQRAKLPWAEGDDDDAQGEPVAVLWDHELRGISSIAVIANGGMSTSIVGKASNNTTAASLLRPCAMTWACTS
jgi:hypothetical protein